MIKDPVAYDGIYMSKKSAAGKKAWDTIRRKQSPLKKIQKKLDKLDTHIHKEFVESMAKRVQQKLVLE